MVSYSISESLVLFCFALFHWCLTVKQLPETEVEMMIVKEIEKLDASQWWIYLAPDSLKVCLFFKTVVHYPTGSRSRWIRTLWKQKSKGYVLRRNSGKQRSRSLKSSLSSTGRFICGIRSTDSRVPSSLWADLRACCSLKPWCKSWTNAGVWLGVSSLQLELQHLCLICQVSLALTCFKLPCSGPSCFRSYFWHLFWYLVQRARN